MFVHSFDIFAHFDHSSSEGVGDYQGHPERDGTDSSSYLIPSMIITGRGGFPRRILRSRLFRISLFLLFTWTFLEALYIYRNIVVSGNSPPIDTTNTQKIFITGLAWNNEILFRTHFINQLQDLVHALGVQNVYISIYENGSYDGTKGALSDLQRLLEQLGVSNRIVLDETSHEDIVRARPSTPKEGYLQIEKSGFEKWGIQKGDYALRRIHYLAQLRNKALEPLWELAEKGEKFDKVLFLSDVVFNSADVLELLRTRDGRYAAACALDFETPPALYDTFALRDSDGYEPLTQIWPYFRSAASRNAIITNQPVPVQSCWNGMVAMPAFPFYDQANHLHFRGVPDSLALEHVEGSECCLIHADNPLSEDLGVWINPNVRVGYCHPDLRSKKIKLDWESFKQVCQKPYDAVHRSGSWVSHFQIAWGLWEHRMWRWVSLRWMQNRKVRRRLQAWSAEGEANVEVGDMCLVDELHILEPHGWLHV